MSQQVLISAQDLKKYFPVKGFLGGKTKYLKAVDGVSLDIMKGETFGLVGESGCGKSTTLRMVAGLEEITWGELYIDGILVIDVEPKDRDIALVFQSYALYPHMTVRCNMEFPL